MIDKAQLERYMKKLIKVVCIIGLLFVTAFSEVVYAEKPDAKEYMEQGIRTAYDNMRLVYQAYYDENGELDEQPAGHVAIEQEWDDEGNLISRTYLGPDGLPMNRIEGYARIVWSRDEDGTWNIEFYDVDNNIIPLKGVYLTNNLSYNTDSWSEWMIPKYDSENSSFTIGYANLGEKTVGDKFTCKVEIEFSDVEGIEGKDFVFWTQGSVDGGWKTMNVWNQNLITFSEPPGNEVYKCSYTHEIDEPTASANIFAIGFRCDNWKSGRFRVRNIQIEKTN